MRSPLPLLLLALAPATSLADEISRRAIDAWTAKQYSVARTGARRAKADVVAPYGFPFPEDVQGSYEWHVNGGALQWSEEPHRVYFQRMGINAMAPGIFHDGLSLQSLLKGVPLEGRQTDEGVEVSVAGPNSGGWKSLRFDREGRLARALGEQADPQGVAVKLAFAFTYEACGDLWRTSGWTASWDMGEKGTLDQKVAATWTRVGGVDLCERLEHAMRRGQSAFDSKTLRFSGWKLDDAIDEPARQGFDESSRKMLDGWKAKQYSLGRLGIRRAFARWKGTVANGQPVITGAYLWDGQRGTFEFDDDEVMSSFVEGELEDPWIAGVLHSCDWVDAVFDERILERFLLARQLAGRQTDAGLQIAVASANSRGVKSVRFDKGGLLAWVETVGAMFLAHVASPPEEGTVPCAFAFRYEPVGENCRLAGWTEHATVGDPGSAKYSTVAIAWMKVGDVHVPARAEQTLARTGKTFRVLEFSDWKFDDDVR